MIKNVGFNQNIQIPQNFAFKSKQEYSPVTSPIENPNLSGADALASYNSAFIKNQNKFDIPLVKPLQIPSDPNAIEGERIYNSRGVLECIVKETKDKKYVYWHNSNDFPGINDLEIYDKNTGNIIFQQSEYGCIDNDGEHRRIWVHEFDSATGLEKFSTYYDEWGKPFEKHARSYNPDGSTEFRTYDYERAEYTLHGCDKDGKFYFDKNYDVNGNLTSVFYSDNQDDGYTTKEIRFMNGKEVSNEVRKSHANYLPEYHQYLQNPELQPTECPEFITSIDNIEGEKTYYSNGQIESVRTSDGKLYEISFGGSYITLYDGNKTIEFGQDKGEGIKSCTVTEDFGNSQKTTRYFGENGNELVSVEYTKGNIEKSLSYYKEGLPSTYREADISNNEYNENICVEFAPNGGVLNVYKDRQPL